MKNIFLSFVLCSRNDGYPQGRGIKLLNFATKHLLSNLNKIKKNFEIIIVDYNPPKNKKKLADLINLKSTKNTLLKIIEVDQVFHNQLLFSDKFPLSQELAYNVAILRSTGKFVITKMADTVYNQDFFDLISKSKLDYNSIYRCSRFDFNIDSFLRLDFSNIDNILPNTSCGDFILISRRNWNKICGWWENGEAYQDGSDVIVIETAKAMNVKEIFLSKVHIYKPDHDLLHEKRTNYKYYDSKFTFINKIVHLVLSILIRLSLTKRKAIVLSRNGKREKVLINIYCYDKIRAIRKNNLSLPLNKHQDWGLIGKDLKIKIL